MSYGLRDIDGHRVELCDECGFDGREERDLGGSFEVAFDSLRRLTAHSDSGRRPEDETWSGSEYAQHCVEVVAEILEMVDRATGRNDAVQPRSLQDASSETARRVVGLAEEEWPLLVDGWPFEVSVHGALVHLLHDLEHHVWDIRRGYAALALRDGIEVVTSR
jgi:hypothetical protein